MQAVWGTDALQRRTCHQKPPNGSQGQRSHPEKSGVIYRYSCDRVECDEEYIGESARTFAERFKEHQKAPSPIYDYSSRSGHEVVAVYEYANWHIYP